MSKSGYGWQTAALILSLIFFSAEAAIAQPYRVVRGTFSSGSGVHASADYGITASLGETTTGLNQSEKYRVYSGFWAAQALFGNELVVPPRRFSLRQNYPNPFNSSTRFSIDLPIGKYLNFTFYDLRGRKVRTLHDGDLAAGHHAITWDGKTNAGSLASSGIYYAVLRSIDSRKTIKLTLLK